jgi:PKD repeat protein
MLKRALILALVILQVYTYAQIQTNKERLYYIAKDFKAKVDKDKLSIESLTKRSNTPVKIISDSSYAQLMYIDEQGNPQYYTIHNENAAKTISTDKVYNGGGAGLSLSGNGIEVGEWDAGSALTTHQEFGGRVTVIDGSSVHWHSTHVAGTIIASGVSSFAKGMAFDATLSCYDWDYDIAEMAEEAAEGLLISNHSYGYLRGWEGSTWWGNPDISTVEDYRFGFYDQNTKNWDEVAYNAPYYLIVKSAGNDRNDSGDGSYPPDGPYDCIGQQGVAKNILTVGAVNDITAGYSQPSDVVMTSFSSWGPADDGRIKPDIVANGTSLNSTYSSANDAYASSSGTSMSSPSVAGSLAILAEHWENTFGTDTKMRAATAKALVIHTADEAGTNDGPDYEFGWGLMNTESAALKISEDLTTDVILEGYLVDGETYTRQITTTGTSPIRATLVWTDPPGSPPAASLDPSDPMLVNDLDLLITEGSNTYYPWKLDKDNPSNAATNSSENDVDNVEVIDIGSPINSATYTITIDHDGTLSGGGQAFSLILSGDIDNTVAPVADFYCDNTEPTTEQSVMFFDASSNIPTSWTWSFSPSTIEYLNGTSSTSQNPVIRFEESDSYNVTVTATNANGSDSETKSSYVTSTSTPQNYCEAYSSYPYGFIDYVKIKNTENPSWFTNVGEAGNTIYYEDFTDTIIGFAIGGSYYIEVGNYYSDNSLNLSIWADWNRDGDFEDLDEDLVYELNNGGEGVFFIDVPMHADSGLTRLRIRTNWEDWFGCLPCGTVYEGEVEDYTLNLQPVKTATWLGNSTDWNDSNNWSNGRIPDFATEITIPTPTAEESPTIQSGINAQCYKLYLESGASLTINGNLEVDK